MLELSKIAGRYSVLHRLHNRGLTTAFLANDERRQDRRVVIEVTRDAGAEGQGDDASERWRAVVAILGQLEHPNLTGLHELVHEEPFWCLVKTWEPGVPLEQWLAETENRAWSLRVSLGRDVLEGLAAMHSAGVLHRDVRPRNVWVTTGGGRPMAQLDSFLDAQPEGIADDRLVGAPGRRAPEVVRSRDYSRRSDVYAAGLLLFDLLRDRGEGAEGSLPGTDEAGLEGGLDESALDLIRPPYHEVVRRATRPFSVERFDDALDLLAAFDAMDLQRRLAEAGID